MVVKRFLQSALLCSILGACNDDRIRGFTLDPLATHDFVAESYLNVTPLAELSNMPIMSTKQADFILTDDTKVQIYAVGEADVNRVNSPEQYLYKGDMIEYYLQDTRYGKPLQIELISVLHPQQKIGDTLYSEINGKKFFVNYDKNLRKYNAIAQIPWQSLNITPQLGQELGFNIAVGDNDDKLKQKSKLVWYGQKDPLYQKRKQLGMLRLVSKPVEKQEEGEINAAFAEHFREETLASMPSAPIKNLAFGQINKEEDLSAFIKSTWDDQNLYIYTEIFDNVPRAVDLAEIKDASAFYDHGWIEDSSGRVVWKMQNYFCRHAGGASKNQLTDTVINLKAGKYRLKYITDESHSWNSWDDRPPLTSFYGIVLFRNQKK